MYVCIVVGHSTSCIPSPPKRIMDLGRPYLCAGILISIVIVFNIFHCCLMTSATSNTYRTLPILLCAKVTVCNTLMSMHSSRHILLVLTMNSTRTSLVPMPEKGRGKGPGFHCLRMCLIAVEFHRHRERLIHVRTRVTSKRIPNVTWSVQL